MRRRHALRRRYGHGRRRVGTGIPFAGTDYIERRYYEVQPAIVSAALGMDNREQKERAIHRTSAVLAWMLDQEPSTVRARQYTNRLIADLRRLIAKAEAAPTR